MANDAHDPKTGQFAEKGTTGSAVGDHQAEQPADANLRRVPGHGTLPRSAPVAMHNHAPSVGTGGGGGGGGGGGSSGGGGGGRLSAAARDRIIRQKGIDQRHFPNRGADATAATDQGQPMAGLTATRGRFKYQQPRH